MTSAIKSIKKRDGSLVQFDPPKINSAIEKAVKAVGGEDTDRVATIARKVVSFLEVLTREGTIPSVEMVQDLVEKVLIEEGHAKVAKAYILYRQQHEEMRKARAFMKGSVQAIDAYVRQTDWRVNENANMAFSLQGLNNHLAQNITSSYWLEKVYPESVAQAHRAGDFHIHDLGMLSVYCCGWDLKDLLV
ncbi:MAG: anaerobic ribonucleoside-triphosphate reductase, partial [Desulfobulbaceae bacterium]